MHCEVYTGDLCTDLRESIRDACFSKAKCAGFDADVFRPRKRGGPAGSGRDAKRQKVDFSIYKDKSSAKWVPKGWCLWKFGLGKCKKSDAECSNKHVKWTAEEFAAAKLLG